MPSSRFYARGAALNGHFYVIGGSTPGVGGTSASVLEYDPASDSRANKTPMQAARQGFALGVIGGKIYVSGGETPNGIIGATEVYSPDNPINPCDAELTAANAMIVNLTSQVNSLTAQNTQYQSELALLTIQNGLLQNEANTLTVQNTRLQVANAGLATQLNAALQTIQDQQSQIKRLQSQLNAIGQHVQILTQGFQASFNDPQFQIPGATSAEQITNLAMAIGNLNFGQKQGLYLNLGGRKPGKGK